MRPVYERAAVCDGFVSFECTPDLADDSEGTVAQALELWGRLDRPNVMIKVPAIAVSPAAIEELTAPGVNVNVTLLFSVERYERVIDTMPEKTLHAFADHGDLGRALDADVAEAERVLAQAADAGLDRAAVIGGLESEGVESFCDSYAALLRCIESRLAAMPA